MTLRDLMGAEAPDVPVSRLAYASTQVVPGAVFFCVPGFRADGHDFAPDAVTRGAAALVCERPLGLGVPEAVVPDVRAAMGPAAARFFGDPTSELRVVGITGTNGKTTTAHLVRSLLEAAGVQCGLLGTVTSVVGGREEPIERTTPEAIDLQASFRRAGLHQPEPGPPRLPSLDGTLLSGQAAAFRAPGGRSRRLGGERRRRVGPAAGRGARRGRDL